MWITVAQTHLRDHTHLIYIELTRFNQLYGTRLIKYQSTTCYETIGWKMPPSTPIYIYLGSIRWIYYTFYYYLNGIHYKQLTCDAHPLSPYTTDPSHPTHLTIYRTQYLHTLPLDFIMDILIGSNGYHVILLLFKRAPLSIHHLHHSTIIMLFRWAHLKIWLGC